MTSRVSTVAFAGIDVLDINVQVQIGAGLPAFTIVGLPDKAVGESRERAALASIGLPMKWALIGIVVANALTTSAHAEDILPLRRGYYVDAEVPCDQASNATLTLFTGKSLGATCVVDSIKKAAETYKIVQTCDIKGQVFINTSYYHIITYDEYIVVDSKRRFHSRYCKQSDLPQPWAKIDLDDIFLESRTPQIGRTREKTP